jgi:hypothetical protein
MSFRQTIHGLNRSDRGFQVIVDETSKKVLISFDYQFVAKKHDQWLQRFENGVGINQLNPLYLLKNNQ